MASFTMNLSSAILRTNTVITVVLPDCARGVKPGDFYTPGKKFKVLWLLHGGGGDNTDWLRKSSIERYACDRELVVVMPDGRGSSYENVDGYAMWDFMNEELMPLVYSYFPVSQAREDNFVAGLSMGGHGTCRWGFLHPEKFQGMAALSCGPFSIVEIMKGNQPVDGRANRIAQFDGDIEKAKEYDYWEMAKKMVESGDPVPKIFIAAGDQDPLQTYRDMMWFKEFGDSIGLKATYLHGPGGHTWEFWDEYIQKALAFFFDE